MSEPKQQNNLVFNEALLSGFIHGTLESAVEEQVAVYFESRPELLEKVSAKSGDGFLKRLRAVQQRSIEKSSKIEKAETVEPVVVNKAAMRSQTAIPKELANYPGYKIIKELGRGGMGVVYLAKNVQMDRLEVLKVLSERLLDHEGAKERFLREIRAVSKLNHTNIVTSYSILPLDNQLVFAMEYVHGIDLQQYTHQHQPLPIGLACSFAKQIAAGLQHAHERGLVHRDIKPSNVIVYKSDGQLKLKILDFGLAKATSEEAAKGTGLTQDGTMLGTPEYMAPEQTMNAAKADIRADIYSLGCTLYYLLIGKPPFTGTHGVVLLAHSQREPTALKLIRPEIPAELVGVVGKVLAKDLHKRFQTPSEVARALSPFVNQSRTAPGKSIGEVPVTNTVNDLNGPDRETSVEASLSELSLEDSHHVMQPQENPAAVEASLNEKQSAPNTQAIVVQTQTDPRKLNWFFPTVIALGSLIFLVSLWQLASFTFRTPNGTIVVENMPADAEVSADGQKLEFASNDGKDKAEVSIGAGTHQLRVLNQGKLSEFAESITPKRIRPSLEGDWFGSWQNSNNERGADSLKVKQDGRDFITGLWSGYVPIQGERIGPNVIFFTGTTKDRQYQCLGFLQGGRLRLEYRAHLIPQRGRYYGWAEFKKADTDGEASKAAKSLDQPQQKRRSFTGSFSGTFENSNSETGEHTLTLTEKNDAISGESCGIQVNGLRIGSNSFHMTGVKESLSYNYVGRFEQDRLILSYTATSNDIRYFGKSTLIAR